MEELKTGKLRPFDPQRVPTRETGRTEPSASGERSSSNQGGNE
jgi:hypothetical protein